MGYKYMNIRQTLGMKPRSLGEGLQRVKNKFNAKGENLSNTLGTRKYSCYTGNETLNIRTDGRKFDSCLVMTVKPNPNKINNSLIGKISDVTKSYARRHVYQDGICGTYQEFRTTTESFKKMPNGKIESYPKDIQENKKVLEPWLFNRISDLYEE